jgi:hypothetical protein
MTEPVFDCDFYVKWLRDSRPYCLSVTEALHAIIGVARHSPEADLVETKLRIAELRVIIYQTPYIGNIVDKKYEKVKYINSFVRMMHEHMHEFPEALKEAYFGVTGKRIEYK